MKTSKEALEYFKTYQNIVICENIFEEELNAIEKDLEVLEILKKHYDVNFLEVAPNYFVGYSIYEDNEDFKKVKEWLEE